MYSHIDSKLSDSSKFQLTGLSRREKSPFVSLCAYSLVSPCEHGASAHGLLIYLITIAG